MLTICIVVAAVIFMVATPILMLCSDDPVTRTIGFMTVVGCVLFAVISLMNHLCTTM